MILPAVCKLLNYEGNSSLMKSGVNTGASELHNGMRAALHDARGEEWFVVQATGDCKTNGPPTYMYI